MERLVTGDPDIFAIESGITAAYHLRGQMALGYFVLSICGNSYGVRSDDATLLACSFSAVQRRIARRGKHRVPFAAGADAYQIADAIQAIRYDPVRHSEQFFGLNGACLRELIQDSDTHWAPDGDAAFDDSSNVLQFDVDNQVRIIGFKNLSAMAEMRASISDVWLSADNFYAILARWSLDFERIWESTSKQ